jgi:phospholipase A-2-activating protein
LIDIHVSVCTLFVDSKTHELISGSWDANAIVWPINDLMCEDGFVALCITGHQLSVWAVSTIPDMPKHYLTGSADKTIRLWHGDKELRKYIG